MPVINATFIKKKILLIYYTKKEEFMQLLFGNFRLATNFLTGNWKPGGEKIPHPHQRHLRDDVNS